jgi:3-hydroxyacyl-[acyl-carrier-protein] dehydratase
MNALDIRQIMEYLPHRYPMLLIDRVEHIETGKSIRAIKNVSINEPFFCGHFPHVPVMPGVLIIEAMAQAAGILSFHSMGKKSDDKSVYYFVGIDGARFKRPVVPGDQLLIEVEVTRLARSISKFTAKATVQGQVAAQAELMCALRSLDDEAAAS